MPDGTNQTDLTQLLVDWSQGRPEALDALLPRVHSELQKLAGAYLRRERPDHTLESGALVNEAYLRLIQQDRVQWKNRTHFYGVAAQLMRRILVDHARSRAALKRGAGVTMLSVSHLGEEYGPQALDLIALDAALTKLAELDPQQSRIVELRFFGELSVEETAELLGISPATVKREWALAKGWLYRQIAGGSYAR